MNDILLLKSLHIGAVVLLFTSLGAILLAGSNKKSGAILHGLSLLLVVLVGFAMLRKPPMNESWWMIKFGLWAFLGISPTLAKRKALPAPVVLILALAAGFSAAWIGFHHPG